MALIFRLLPVILLALSYSWPLQVSAANPHEGYILDLSDAEVDFSVDVLGLFRVDGRFEQVKGGLVFSETCTAKSIAFSIQTASVNTDNRLRDRIIRGPALLNSRQHPVIAFASTRIVNRDGRPGMIAGLLEMNGKTREVSFHIEAIPPEADGASTAQGYRAVTSISRADFGIPSPMIGTSDTVSIRVTLGMRQETLRLATTTTMEVTP